MKSLQEQHTELITICNNIYLQRKYLVRYEFLGDVHFMRIQVFISHGKRVLYEEVNTKQHKPIVSEKIAGIINKLKKYLR